MYPYPSITFNVEKCHFDKQIYLPSAPPPPPLKNHGYASGTCIPICIHVQVHLGKAKCDKIYEQIHEVHVSVLFAICIGLLTKGQTNDIINASGTFLGPVA